MSNETKTYTVGADCSNCGWSGSVTLNRGYEFHRWGADSREACPTCGCHTLRRRSNRPMLGGAS